MGSKGPTTPARPAAPPEPTRGTGFAANLAAAAVCFYALLFLLSTQIPDVRTHSPWTEDPYDLVATFVAVFLPAVVAITWLRSVAHRGPVQTPPAVLGLIQRGVATALLAIGVACAGDWLALLREGADASPAAILLLSLLGATSLVTAVAAASLLRARNRGRAALPPEGPRAPDALDDLVTVAALVSPGLGARIARAGPLLRRHRRGLVVASALLTLLAAPLWHALREGVWATPAAALLFGAGLALFVAVTAAFAIGQLRALRR